MNKKLFVSVLAAAVLSACGGGGDGGNTTAPTSPTTPTNPTAPTTPTSTAPVTDVPAADYTDLRATLFTQLNDFRAAVGVGKLKQDPKLDVAAQAHADYLKANLTIAHDELPTNAGYYEATPRSRATKAGVDASQWIAEVAGGTALLPISQVPMCMRMTNSVYHQQAILGNAENVGLGINDYACSIDMAVVTLGGVSGSPPANSLPVGNGQLMAANAIGVTPIAGSKVDGAMPPENPQPAPDITSPGHPLMVRVRADTTADKLTVSNFTLIDNVGATIPGRVLVASNAISGTTVSGAQADNMLYPGVAFFMPLSPLASGKTYTATFAGARNGTAISTSWSFSTN
ncbi:CAP domain-containing protein [Cupriavidus pauculus]|uniref:CAP domain-containing protein n=1 Tax=Cupriavidus pauculus TaxID=82633 RepID=UPI003857DC3A